MYLYSSNSNSLKIMLSKSDAEQLIFNQPSLTLRKNIIFAILRAALPKSNFSLSRGNLLAKLIEYPKGRFILEFTFEEQFKQLFCYSCANLKDVAQALQDLKRKRAKVSKLYFKGNRYFLLSEKHTNGKNYNSSEHIEGVLEEYAHLISENATEEIARLL